MDVKCQCTTVAFKTPTPEPLDVYFCHCSECRKQSASAFGTSAIFPAEGLFPLSDDLREKLQVWTRPTKTGGQMDCYFCRNCGSRVFHRARKNDGTLKPTISIKGGMIVGLKIRNPKHIWTESAVMTIPEGEDAWPQSPPETPAQ
ncbi:hypothetical protein C8034_v006254 [Colletotrichum sidae]|uniref:CENP-V/GFA domain-containing protein n=1 Tax=Colletotrichum sidae TaxID=1347389 RepID=A0A4R8T6R0_9PEZI|nr:hypothetical protein C8034_v006254 [Colletotrichum sidae]